MNIILPSSIHEGTISSVIQQINDADGCETDIIVNLSNLSFTFPIGTLVLAQYLRYNRESKGRSIKFISSNIYSSVINYLTSVGFFKYFGENPFCANDLNKSKTYIPFSIIEWSDLQSRVNDERLNGHNCKIQDVICEYSDNYSDWMFGKIEPVISYCFREIIRNVFEHTNCLYCSIFGQIYPTRDEIEICIADSGSGIRNTLSKVYPECVDDEWALTHAILPGITSGAVKIGSEYDNSGFGLYVLSQIAQKFGYMWIGSGEKFLKIDSKGVHLFDGFYPGTFVGINFKYQTLLRHQEWIMQIINEGESLSRKLGINGAASTSTKSI